MKNIFLVFVITVLFFISALGSILVFTDVYEETDSRIVSVLCLSCIKLDPVNSFGWNADKNPPNFIVDSLDSTGPIFIAYRTDVCEYCDYMEPLLMEMFNVTFEKEDVFSTVVDFNGTKIVFVHINLDHASGELKSSRNNYDINGDRAVPMFTTITIQYDRGIVTPYYNTIYGKIKKSYTDEQRKQVFANIINEAIKFYDDNIEGFRVGDFR